jgi:hypothetical protein
MGSDVDIVVGLSSPTRFDHAWDLAGHGELAETNTAQIEFADVAARAAAAEASIAKPDLHARGYVLVRRDPGSRPVFLRHLRCSCHVFLVL